MVIDVTMIYIYVNSISFM